MNIRSLFLLSLFAACTTTDEVGEVHQQSSDWGIELQTTKVSLVSDLESTCGPNAQPDPYCMATCTEGGSTDVCLKKCGCVPLETTDASEEVAIGESTISESSVYRTANVRMIVLLWLSLALRDVDGRAGTTIFLNAFFSDVTLLFLGRSVLKRCWVAWAR